MGDSTMFGDASAGFAQRTQSLLAVAKGASPVTENEFKLFKRAMGEQGQSKSSVADVIAAASKKGQVDAWGASGGMPVVGQQKWARMSGECDHNLFMRLHARARVEAACRRWPGQGR